MDPVVTKPPEAQLAALSEAWDEFFGAVRRAKGRASRQHGVELTLPQFHLLDALVEHPSARCGVLAEAADIAAPTASRMIDGLEREGIVERRPSPDDRRAVEIALTERGRELHARKRELVQAKRAELFGSLSEAERDGAEHLLRRLAEVIDEL
jgi:MarR family transcriptional regulator, organic hydroperoxide resistance regulator